MKSWLLDNRVFVKTQFQLLGLPVEATFDSEVLFYIERYLRRGRYGTERLLGKGNYYFPIFEAELAARGLPEALKYLPVVESSLRPSVESPVGARGLWQFMPATANFFDLKINKWVDERCDPQRSSAAAAEFLSFLYKRFDDWSLALAAYNCGPGRVKKAIRRVGRASYGAIKDQLPRQTQRYITKFKAAAYAMAFYDFFGLEPRPDRNLPSEVESVVLENSMTFEEIAEQAGISVDVVKAINPVYLKEIVPAGKGVTCRVLLPASAVSTWVASRKKAAVAKKGHEKVERENEKAVVVALPPEGSLLIAEPLLLSSSKIIIEKKKKITMEWPLPEAPPSDDEPRETVALWYQRNGMLDFIIQKRGTPGTLLPWTTI